MQFYSKLSTMKFLFFAFLIAVVKCVPLNFEATTDLETNSGVYDKLSSGDENKNLGKQVFQQTTLSDVTKDDLGVLKTSDFNAQFKSRYANTDNPDEETTATSRFDRKHYRQKSNDNNYDARKVYLEDVLYALKNQNWTKDELPCLNATAHLLRSLQNFTLWAVWEWDSISSQPQGLLYGNRFELGNFDECMNAPWKDSHPELMTQYCLAEIQLERTDKHVTRKTKQPFLPYDSALDVIMRNKTSIHRPLNELTWGGCVPVSCGSKSVERLMATLLARSHFGVAGMRARISVTETCQRPDQPREYDSLFYGFLTLMAILIISCSICTYLNCKRNSDPLNLKDEIVQACCLKRNAANLLKMKKEGVEILYGIKFITIVLIVIDHQFGIYNSGPISDGLFVDQASISTAGMFILHDDLFVDTFFVISGFLVALNLMKLKDKPVFNPLMMILRRYMRLIIAFAVVVFYYVAVYPYTGTGPLWDRSIAGETDPCKKNWWLSMLMLSNYVNSDDICIVVSWYIPCDFHCFIVAVLVFWLYKHRPTLAMVAAALLGVASIIVPGVINYVNELPAIQLLTYDFVKNPRANEQFHMTYIKSHVRFAAYVVGVLAGYLLVLYKTDGKNVISKKWSIIGVIAGLIIMAATMIGGTTYLVRKYHPLEGALYAAFNRPLWAGGLALVILCCCLGSVPFVEGILTWYPWVPLSRLSYGLYLTHTALITRNVYVTRSPHSNDYTNLLTSAAGVVLICCLAALALLLFAESPINNLFVILFLPKSKNRTEASNRSEHNNTSMESVASTSGIGYLKNNLPNSIEFSSKM